jgi:riboflavin kinase/FMN adenylyltransferase
VEIIDFIYPNITENKEKIVLCLGYFDGVHLGHQELIKNAKKVGYKVGVLTFDNSPAYILGKISQNQYLTSVADKAEYLSELGVDYLYLMHFGKVETLLTKDEFIENVIKVINPISLFCGEDYRFGARGEGDPKYLSRFFATNVQEIVKTDNLKVASRDILKAIASKKPETATKLLGRPYRINGLVVEGAKKGRTINFPTANLELAYPYVYPATGVYIGYADVYGEKYKAIINVGTHPTINPLAKPLIEVHLIDYEGNLYGEDIFVEFISYIREEKTFESLQDLKKQLLKDEEVAKKTLK